MYIYTLAQAILAQAISAQAAFRSYHTRPNRLKGLCCPSYKGFTPYSISIPRGALLTGLNSSQALPSACKAPYKGLQPK